MKCILISRDGGLQRWPSISTLHEANTIYRVVYFAAVPDLKYTDLEGNDGPVLTTREVAYEKLGGGVYLNGARLSIYLEKP